MKANSRLDDDVDPVERSRQARRELEQQFATPEEYFDWVQRLDQQRLATERPSAKGKPPRKPKPTRRAATSKPARKNAKPRARS